MGHGGRAIACGGAVNHQLPAKRGHGDSGSNCETCRRSAGSAPPKVKYISVPHDETNRQAVLSECEKFNVVQARLNPLVELLKCTPSHKFNARIQELGLAMERLTAAWKLAVATQTTGGEGLNVSITSDARTTLDYEAIVSDCDIGKLRQARGATSSSSTYSKKRHDSPSAANMTPPSVHRSKFAQEQNKVVVAAEASRVIGHVPVSSGRDRDLVRLQTPSSSRECGGGEGDRSHRSICRSLVEVKWFYGSCS
ncbi:hypothetical protein PybrP1_008322 [[Pythium] brassicae (nom. inval.)]|nr:hypothetical protein PybrP1_008322 [[Pythium] brassicae (nom. inval.)]